MFKKLLTIALILFFSTGLINAKEKAVSLKKFKQTDIGNPAITGSSSIQNNGIQIIAGGADVWGVKDQFHFSYLEKTGDFDLIARIESLSAPHMYTKAGLMAREELTDNSRHIFFQVFPDNKPRNKNNGGFEFQYRAAKEGDMKAIYPASATGIPDFPVNYPNTWIRLKRSGDDFTGYCSTDGKTWKAYTTFTLALSKKLYLGLAVTSHNTKEAAKAVFKDISMVK
jgi:regulation of enolase protein 1 (concanavalin A-like superfamily)